jgi:pimeloyl-ACP methyl ester carboxylesterase
VEFLDVIEPLADPRSHGGDPADAFHVVCPSMPGYAFSGPTRERGWDPARVARAWSVLMAGLGYDRYGAQGGDWGAFVTREIALADPVHCAGIHLNMWPPMPGSDDDPSAFTADEQVALADFATYLDDGSGYQRIQSTRPHTLGFALEDSPAGLAAWIVEKVRAWSDCGGNLEPRFSKDTLLDNIMCYWVTATATSSARLYAEFDRALRTGAVDLSARVEVPTGYARYPAEIMRTSQRWIERQFPIVHFAEMPRGGHFAAWEEPQLFVDDLRACFRVVQGR